MNNKRDYTQQIVDYIKQEINILTKLDYPAISEVMNILETARERGSTVYICGNGGSAATASHFVSDFNKGVSYNKENKYKFICLNDNIPTIMAIANDCGYEEIFVQQLKERTKTDDVLLCISGSGNSKKCNKVAITNDIVYNYDCSTSGISQNIVCSEKTAVNFLDSHIFIRDFFIKIGCFDKRIKQCYYHYIFPRVYTTLFFNLPKDKVVSIIFKYKLSFFYFPVNINGIINNMLNIFFLVNKTLYKKLYIIKSKIKF